MDFSQNGKKFLVGLKRNRGDAIQFFKFNESYNKAESHHPNPLTNSLRITGPAGSIRGEKHRLSRQFTKNFDQRGNFFTNRVVTIWNSLPEHVIKAKSINEFKNRYDKSTQKNYKYFFLKDLVLRIKLERLP